MKKILNIILVIGLFLLNIFWDILCVYLLSLAKIDIASYNNLTKNLLLIIINIPVIIICYFSYFKSNKIEFKNFINNFSTYIKENTKYWLIAFGIMIGTNILITIIFNLTNSNNQELIEKSIKALPLYLCFSSIIYAPLVEEIIFRKGISKIIKNKEAYLIISGFLFGLMHVVSSPKISFEYLYIIPYGALGFAFAYMYYKTKNIYIPIFFHMMHNLLAFTITIIGMWGIK